MARNSTLWRRKRDGAWMTTLRGKQHNLGKDKTEAKRAFHALLAKDAPPVVTARLTVRKLADQYLAFIERTAAPNTFGTYLLYLQKFCDHLGNRAVADLRVEHVTAWEAKNPRWSRSTVASVRAMIVSCLNWGVKQGVIEANPIPRLKSGRTERRERLLTAEEIGKVKAVASPAMLDFFQALDLTGARPFSEVARLTAADIDWAAGSITLAEHKNEKKGKTRTIYLTPPLEALLRRKCEEHPSGLLFRTTLDAPFAKGTMCRWLKRAAETTGVKRLNLYLIRHYAVTRALENGVTSDVAGELFGNSPATIQRYYSKLSEKKAALRAAALRAVGVT